jgi:GT2 family glycosyltransferase
MSALLAEVVVVTYFSRMTAARELDEFVARARSEQGVQWTFVDNSPDSSDGAYLHSLVDGLANVRCLTRPENPGFAASCNEIGLATEARWVVLINPDILLNERSFHDLLCALHSTDDRYGAVAFSQHTGELHHEGIGFNRWGWFMDRPLMSSPQKERFLTRGWLYRRVGGDGELMGPSGGAAAYRAGLFRECGGFSPDLFAWGEDADLALRLHLKGTPCGSVDVNLAHQGGHSVIHRSTRRRRAYLLVRNRIWVAARHYSSRRVVLFTIFLAATLLAKTPKMVREGTLRAHALGVVAGYLRFSRQRREHVTAAQDGSNRRIYW